MEETPSGVACPSCGGHIPDDISACPQCGFDLAAEPHPFKEGTVLESRYRIDTEVGRGGMGVVYRGTDLTLKRPVAIKAMRTSDADPQVLARFMREARSLARVEHAGLVPVYAVGREAGNYYMVMKFVEGETLSQMLRRQGAIDPDVVRRIVREVCDALGALHRAGLIHRDMKPGNLMVGPDGRVTVMDLGIVKSVGETTQTHSTALGTPRYMAPEMVGDGEIDQRIDIYSLGVIAYQMLLGEPPFDGPTPMAILYKQAHEPPESLRKRDATIPKNLAAAVERALEKDPEARWGDMQAFAEAVEPHAAVKGRRKAVPLPLIVGAALVIALGAFFALRGEQTVAADAGAVAKSADAAKPKPDLAKPKPDAAPVPKKADAATPAPDAAAPAPKVEYVTLQLLSDPPGASVYAGSRRLGITPTRVRRRKSAKSLTLSFKLKGYKTRKTRVSQKQNGRAKARLEPIFELVP